MSRASENVETAKKTHRRVIVAGAVFAVLAGPWAARALVLRLATRASVDSIRQIADSLPESSDGSASEGLMFPLLPFDSIPEVGANEESQAPESEESVLEKPISRKMNRSVKVPTAPLGPTPSNTRASVKRVLGWAQQELVPQGVHRAAEPGIPGGIELYGVGPLGIGLLDGDRLISVDGAPVLERGEVIGAVLGARARRAVAMTAKLVRRTKDGPVEFSVVVEQPYPEHLGPDGEVPQKEPTQEEPTKEPEEQLEAPEKPTSTK